MSTDSREAALRLLLKQASLLLNEVEEPFWSSRIDKALVSVDAHEVLSWFGGMGSFNDLVIANVNGHRVKPSQEPQVNARLDALRSQLYQLAKQLS